MMQNTLLSIVPAAIQLNWTELTATIWTIKAANIVGIMITSRENWASVANYVERILRLKKREIEAVEHVSLPA